jgi:CubicO group peptidase (beta-lactamase class C family)
LRDVFLLLELSGLGHDQGDLNDVLLTLLARQRSLNYEPGTESQYNNGGYVVALPRRVVSTARASVVQRGWCGSGAGAKDGGGRRWFGSVFGSGPSFAP